jgi:large subunit ribosomal protein L17
MRHRIAGGQLNRTSAHRVALRRNLAASLFEHETISTTMPKAKHVRSFVEKLITLAKKGDLAARRRAIALLGNRNIVEEVDGEVKKKGTVIGKLFSEIGPRYLDRAGGYTRIIKLAKTRLGDNSPLVLLQLVGQESKSGATEKSGKKKASKKKTSKSEKTEE